MTAVEPPEGSVKLTVWLAAEAYAALVAAAERTGETRTDTVNRALLAWDQVTAEPDSAFRLKAAETGQ